MNSFAFSFATKQGTCFPKAKISGASIKFNVKFWGGCEFDSFSASFNQRSRLFRDGFRKATRKAHKLQQGKNSLPVRSEIKKARREFAANLHLEYPRRDLNPHVR